MQTSEYKANQAAFAGRSTGDHGILQSWGSGASSTDDALPDGVLVSYEGIPLIDFSGFYILEHHQL
jgi:hypothetical protein